MSEKDQPNKIHIGLFSVIIPAIAALVTVIATIYQAATPQKIIVLNDRDKVGPLQVELFNLKKDKQYLEDKLKRMQEQIDSIKAAQKKLNTEKTGSAPHSENINHEPENNAWYITVLKTFVVYITLFLSAFLTIFTFVGDLVGLFFGYSFDITRFLWAFSWDKVTIEWYWTQSAWPGIAVGVGVGVFGGALLDS